MPRQFLYDLDAIDLTQTQFDIEVIRSINPQRGHFEMLSAIVSASQEMGGLIARKEVRADEFWVPGHIPGRPLFPGVLMIEAAAQSAAFYTKKYVGWPGFIGFGGTGETKFRAQVTPGDTLYILIKLTWARHRRIACDCQGVVNGNLVFESTIIGTQM
jgi:3-hydroxyacyl-[acyl-carrier-protein] dehydratase